MRRAAILALLLFGCAGGTAIAPEDAGEEDAALPDASGPDAGEPDAGEPDAGAPDAGDAGLPDSGDAGQPDAGGPHIQTVFIILMENDSWAAVKGNSSAPYINNTLLSIGAHAEAYKGALSGNLHPSEPNYIWLEAGDNLGILNDSDPSSNHKAVTDHLVTLLEDAGVSWRSYQEDIDAGTCPLTSHEKYAPKHDPMVFFDDVMNDSSRCIAHVRPLTELEGDLDAGTVARYNFITPNLCHDMHDSCAPTSDSTRQGDDWLAHYVPLILASPAYGRSAVFVTWDESDGFTLACPLGNCPIGMIVVSPFARAGHASTVALDHSSTLKSLQEIFGVRPLLRHAGDTGVHDLADLFSEFP